MEYSVLNEENEALINMHDHFGVFNAEVTEFTDIVGENGKWQVKLVLLSSICEFTSALNHLAMSFLAFPVDHWCSRPKDFNNSLDIWWSEFLPNATIKGLSQHSQCEKFVFNNTSFNTTDRITVSCNAWEYSSEFNSVANHWDVVCDKEWFISTSQSAYMIGFLFAAFLSGQISDLYGRYPAIMINVIISIIAGVAVAFSSSFLMFSVSRFFVGIGQAGMGLVLFVLLIESVGPRHRVKYIILCSLGWNVGQMLLPLMAWLLQDWYTLQLAITAPSLLFISFYWILPESPRWLLSSGKLQEALPILREAAIANEFELKDLEKKAESLCNSSSCTDKTSVTVIDLLKTPNLRKNTFCLYFIWIVIAFVYYGLSLNTNDLKGDIYWNFAFSGIMEFPAAAFCLFTMDQFGRKKPFIFSFLVGGIFCLGCIFVPKSYALVSTAFSMIGKLFIAAGFRIVYIYSAEIFPTVARNIGVGSCSTMARIGSTTAPFMKDLSKITDPSVPLVTYGILSIICAGLLILLPETKNSLMPETLEQAEMFGKADEKLELHAYSKMTITSSE
ncbi:organic cation transporter protein-like isoform X2 [Uloborus diversus]|nr:organic cation transporter protein-like isoform X2 [Uloborus diversus]